ncbi:oligoendopeptidase F [candidate division KSB3 bacterium]|uniref:Oligopeptidase F n=1 Tax=candidate division KSB3 bacterium TaxID=2044937 RepID=A0A2G6E1Y4_9BACT|nr:MAG: oligoendopeptidase F [candidate division KSB3 bacterium]PIE28578.1 MAG: oligoendopeptidase F [candidate division KSB3 bacterium]
MYYPCLRTAVPPTHLNDESRHTGPAADITREQIDACYRWNLEDLYADIETWRRHKETLLPRINALMDYKGTLAQGADNLFAALTLYFEITKAFYKLHSYAHQLSDQDLRVAAHQELMQELQAFSTLFGEKTAFLVTELSAVAPETLRSFAESIPALEEFSMFLQDIQRMRQHTLSEAEETLMASAADLMHAAENVFRIFSNAEFPFPDITLSTGERVTLTAPQYTKRRTSPVREDRQQVMQRFLEAHGKFKNTFGANLIAKLKSDYFHAKNRKYASCLEASLSSDNIPVSVYENLIAQIHRSLPSLHRALDLRRRMLGLDELHYYDLYASIVKDLELTYSIEEGQQRILESLQPLGEEYLHPLRTGFQQRWIDYLPTPGKRSGAYSNGAAYDEHPYILMNWNGNYDSLSTLIHEIGHTMHSYFSNSSQPFAKANYSIFVAEIASTFNENLLHDYLIAHAATQDEKLFLLGHYLDSLRGTIFRQAQFAEFEWDIHKKIEAGDALSGESLSAVYDDLTKRYYGHDQGICLVDDYVRFEWAFIPHFYYNFYVFQYATSLIYSTALAEKVQRRDAQAVENYLTLLKSGASAYPIDLIRKAGIEPLSSEAFELTLQRMHRTIDQIEALVEQKAVRT